MTMRSRIHPSKRKLAGWLETGGPEEVDLHVAGCERCATSLEALAIPEPKLGDALAAFLAPPEDLVTRMNDRISDSLRNRADLKMFAELVGLPIPTAQLLLTERPLDD